MTQLSSRSLKLGAAMAAALFALTRLRALAAPRRRRQALPAGQILSATALTDPWKVLGNSTLHKWTVKATQVAVHASLAPAGPRTSVWEAHAGGGPQRASL